MYLLALIIPFCLTYFILAGLFSLFFDKHLPVFHTGPMRSLFIIVLLALGVFAIMSMIPDPEIANRIEHAVGGGVLATLICFLVVRDTRPSITRFQFFIFSALVVTSLGVVNELVEFFLQAQFHLTMSRGMLDTWLDLSSNTVGTVLALVALTPFVGRHR